MAVQVSYPGVYIEEFAPGAPIQGVGTSTAGLIGVAARGELDVPVKLTSWDQFVLRYGEQPVPGFYLWYAARGFFENGGSVCYIVRASNGAYAQLPLNNRDGDPMAVARAVQPGNPTTPVEIAIATNHVLPAADTSLYQPTGTYSAINGRAVTVTDAPEAAQFRPGDRLDVGGQQATLVGVSGNVLRLDAAFVAPPAAPGAVRLANAPAGTRTIRIISTNPLPSGTLVPGMILTVTQGGDSDSQVVSSVQSEPLQTNPATTTYRVTFQQGLDMSLTLDPGTPASVESEEFDVVVTQGAASTTYQNLSADSAHPRYFVDYVNARDNLLRLQLLEPPPPALPPANLPADLASTALANGVDENLDTIGDNDFIDALDTLQAIDDVNLVAVPDRPTPAVQQAVIAHCELMADRFAVLDARPALELFGADSIEAQRAEVDSTRGFAALYYPWLRVPPAGAGAPVLVPPSGHVCGIMARSDASRGVHKAPANEIVNGALGVERTMSDIEQGQLNLPGVNVIRVFQGGARPVLWGARTTATDRNWQYVNIRRLFLFLEESIEEGIRWAVFEPNNLQLWQKLKRTISEFLTRVWRDGALFGATPEEAFYVRIDEILNPFSEQALGRLNIEIGVRPTYPAEFIIVRIGIWDGGSEVSEG